MDVMICGTETSTSESTLSGLPGRLGSCLLGEGDVDVPGAQQKNLLSPKKDVASLWRNRLPFVCAASHSVTRKIRFEDWGWGARSALSGGLFLRFFAAEKSGGIGVQHLNQLGESVKRIVEFSHGAVEGLFRIAQGKRRIAER